MMGSNPCIICLWCKFQSSNQRLQPYHINARLNIAITCSFMIQYKLIFTNRDLIRHLHTTYYNYSILFNQHDDVYFVSVIMAPYINKCTMLQVLYFHQIKNHLVSKTSTWQISRHYFFSYSPISHKHGHELDSKL